MRGTGDGPIAHGKTQRRWLAVIAGRHPGTRDIWPQGQIRLLGGKTLGSDRLEADASNKVPPALHLSCPGLAQPVHWFSREFPHQGVATPTTNYVPACRCRRSNDDDEFKSLVKGQISLCSWVVHVTCCFFVKTCSRDFKSCWDQSRQWAFVSGDGPITPFRRGCVSWPWVGISTMYLARRVDLSCDTLFCVL